MNAELHMVSTDVLRIAFADLGPRTGRPVVLLHGFPYDPRSYADVAPLLVEAGHRVIVPYLRGHGPNRFLKSSTFRSGQQAALGADLLALIDALELDEPILAGYDWGGRAACVVAALHPERVGGLVSVNGYLIQDIAAAQAPIAPELEAGFWYFWYFATERGRRGLTANRRDIARVIWSRNSPEWAFSEDLLDEVSRSFENPDYVDVVVHSYRHRLGLAPGAHVYATDEERLAAQPPIPVPTITLDGTADGNFPATDGSQQSHLFTGRREHRQVPHAGHHLPAEAPWAFANAVLDLAEWHRDGGGHLVGSLSSERHGYR